MLCGLCKKEVSVFIIKGPVEGACSACYQRRRIVEKRIKKYIELTNELLAFANQYDLLINKVAPMTI